MRVALVSPLYESVPPRFYGGTERIVAFLAEALVDLGHEVVVYASGDSRVRTEVRAIVPTALRLDGGSRDPLIPHLLQMERVIEDQDEFDVVHFHTDILHFPAIRRMRVPYVATLHGRLDLPDLGPVYDEYADAKLVSISNHQRTPLPNAPWLATVHHGLPKDLIPFREKSDGYLAFLGRISPEKRPDRAIEIAARAGKRIKIAAKVDRADERYYASIRHLFRQPHVDFIGEISDREKPGFLGGADALLFPIDWPEPFGLVMIEAMAAGTPVIAFANGSVPEVIRPGLSGLIVDSIGEAVDAVELSADMSRARVRADFETRFSSERMASDYVRIYESLFAEKRYGVQESAEACWTVH